MIGCLVKQPGKAVRIQRAAFFVPAGPVPYKGLRSELLFFAPMSTSVAAAGLLLLLGLGACQSETKPGQAVPETAPTESATLAVPAPPADQTAAYLADPQVNDVLVVRFVPEGSQAEQFYFYQVFRLGGDTVYTHPARQPVASADADASRPDTYAPEATRAFTKKELQEFRQESPADPQHSRLVRVRRGDK